MLTVHLILLILLGTLGVIFLVHLSILLYNALRPFFNRKLLQLDELQEDLLNHSDDPELNPIKFSDDFEMATGGAAEKREEKKRLLWLRSQRTISEALSQRHKLRREAHEKLLQTIKEAKKDLAKKRRQNKKDKEQTFKEAKNFEKLAKITRDQIRELEDTIAHLEQEAFALWNELKETEDQHIKDMQEAEDELAKQKQDCMKTRKDGIANLIRKKKKLERQIDKIKNPQNSYEFEEPSDSTTIPDALGSNIDDLNDSHTIGLLDKISTTLSNLAKKTQDSSSDSTTDDSDSLNSLSPNESISEYSTSSAKTTKKKNKNKKATKFSKGLKKIQRSILPKQHKIIINDTRNTNEVFMASNISDERMRNTYEKVSNMMNDPNSTFSLNAKRVENYTLPDLWKLATPGSQIAKLVEIAGLNKEDVSEFLGNDAELLNSLK